MSLLQILKSLFEVYQNDHINKKINVAFLQLCGAFGNSQS